MNQFNLPADKPIDAVIMWVDGSDPKFIESEKKHIEIEKANGKEIVHSAARHRDNGELRYLLRSIHHNLGWINKVYIVTNGQLPSYVDFSSEDIVHISHSDIFPDESYLPSFNTFSIESFIHNIPGLSENYIRFSDDFFIGKKITKSEYLTKYSSYIFKNKTPVEPKNGYQIQLKNSATAINDKLGFWPSLVYVHAPQLRNKSMMERFVLTFKSELDKTRSNRFRTRKDIISLAMYPYFHFSESNRISLEKLNKKLDGECFYIQDSNFSERYAEVALGKEGKPWRKHLQRIIKKAPCFFNINDSYSEDQREIVVKEMIDFLEVMFPEASRWERI